MPATDRFAAARAVIQSGLDARAFPAAAIEVGSSRGPEWCEAFGALSYEGHAPPATRHTVFDLASLTKVIATVPLAMRFLANGLLHLDAPVSRVLRSWTGADRQSVTVRQLLDHSSGLPAHEKLYERGVGRHAFEAMIAATPLASPPGTEARYSDLGFMLLGFILEDLEGTSLDEAFASRVAPEIGGEIAYLPPGEWLPRIAPTERGVPPGAVHDENARALGGVAGHAGLFGTVDAVGQYARAVLATFCAPTWLGAPEQMRVMASPGNVPGSSRALGWDTMRPTSSCGRLMSPTSIGHTGFTGTSLWIDRERDVYVVFLTNRVHPTRENQALVALRPRVHDAILEAVLRS